MNALNQYTNRTVPSYVEMDGSAATNATIDVNGFSPLRQSSYFREELVVNNTNSAAFLAITNIATDTTSTSLVARTAFVPRTPEAYQHDADGNFTQDGRWKYNWDGENRLVQMESLTNVVSAENWQRLDFVYDAQGRRLQKEVRRWDTAAGAYKLASRRKFFYQGWNLVGELDEVSGTRLSYTWGQDLSGTLQGAGGVGGLLFVTLHSTNAPATYLCAYDGNGNLTGLIKTADGSEGARYEYGPFGEAIQITGAMAKANPFRFSTKYHDDESEQVYYGYRAYNPSTGRWLSRDPIASNPRKMATRWIRETMNPYHFVQNDPIRRYDRLGLHGNPVPPSASIPISKVNCPSTCGPDYTASVNSEIARLRGHLAGLPEFPLHLEIDAEAQGAIATYNLSRFYLWFATLAGRLNYDSQAKNAVQGVPLSGCPTVKCLGTYTLCGKCVSSDVAGNIMFGFAAAGAGIGDSMRNFGANVRESTDFDGEADFPRFGDEDRDVFPLGKRLFFSGSNDICSVLNNLPNHAKRDDCSPCSKVDSFEPARFPDHPRYQ